MSLDNLIPSVPSQSSLRFFSQLEFGQCDADFNDEHPELFSQKIASSSVNKKKNRYADILAYDNTRVKLNNSDRIEDYINANFVEYPNVSKYIAAQAPLPNTLGEFWQMIWEQQCPAIIVLTKEQEGYKLKYHPYCPIVNKPLISEQHDIKVEFDPTYMGPVSKSIQYNRYIVSRPSTNEAPRTVIQIKFEDWDHGTPNELEPFVELLESSRLIQSTSQLKGPPVVHCSAGCGRTGTYCVIDTVLKLLPNWPATESRDIICHVVHQFRQQRPYFVQTSSQ
ncbi:receptor/non-receptor type protein-tyrosine phosphatase, partial [Conidiobolus coronatus NRRL 28638]